MRSSDYIGWVIHVGPDRTSSGGMASVIDEMVKNSSSKYRVSAVSTWAPGAPLAGAFLVVRALFTILKGRLVSRGDRVLVHIHLSEGGSFWREGGIGIASRLVGFRFAATLHGADFVAAGMNGLSRIQRLVLGRASLVFCLGPRSARFIREQLPGVHVETVLNPVSTSSGLANAKYNVIFAGELSTRKGFDRVIELWRSPVVQTNGWTLVACGPKADVDVSILPPGIHYLGNLPRDEVQAVMRTVRLALLPSRREVLPMFVIEALKLGLPVVCTSVGELSQFGPDDGVLVGDDRTLGELTNSVLADSQQWQFLHRSALRWAEGSGDARTIMRRIENAYDCALSNA